MCQQKCAPGSDVFFARRRFKILSVGIFATVLATFDVEKGSDLGSIMNKSALPSAMLFGAAARLLTAFVE